MMKGKYIVFIVLAIAIALTLYLVIFKPGPMSARKVAYVKQMELFGSESNFKISQTQIDTMSIAKLDSAIVLFNDLIRSKDSLDALLDIETSKNVSLVVGLLHDATRLRDRQKVATAYLDLLSGATKDTAVVDSLAMLSGATEWELDLATQYLFDMENLEVKGVKPREFDLLYRRLYGEAE